ncbi:hypothetical protein FN846DRAFT_885729 [Sphaerosporella brunnea]|uniref:Uncharacterized protein n=1 Tax=Sphaerosporella brunnea TaxID=1250544 RepID=A0A5J5FB29_9PEZI|nr:hypothetical protein FN846DRAFT_885729 [Sphaerosporella brunnea]
MKQLEAAHLIAQRSSPYLGFLYPRRIIFREQVAGKQSVDAVGDYDSGAKTDLGSDLEGTGGDGTEIHSDHDAREGADSAAEASQPVHLAACDLYAYTTYIPWTSRRNAAARACELSLRTGEANWSLATSSSGPGSSPAVC